MKNYIRYFILLAYFLLSSFAAEAYAPPTGTGSAVYSISPALTGNPTAPTQSFTDNSTKLATTAQVFGAVTNPKVVKIGFSALSPTTGQQGTFFVFPVSGTITGWDFVADTGTATVQVWKIAAGTAAPTVSNSINTSGVALATGTAIESTTVTDFTTTTVTAGDIFAFNLSAVSGSTKLYFDIQITEQ